MTATIRNIFETNIRLLGDIDKSVYYFREQEFDKALGIVVNSIDQINLVLESIITDREYFNVVDTESLLEMLTGILAAQKNEDYILLCDLLELQLINFLSSIQELIISKEVILFDEDGYRDNIELLLRRETGFHEELREPIDTAKLLENGYRIEFTSCGLMTLAAENQGRKFYFHTNSKIQSEAFLLARHWKKEEIYRYVIFGFGMGYHIRELHKLAPEAMIEVYETDRNVVMLACAFADVKDLLQNDKIALIYDPELKKIAKRFDELNQNEISCIHYPSYKNIRSGDGKQIFEIKRFWPEVSDLY